MSFLSMLRYYIKLIFSTDEANRKLYRENCFSKEFLLDALQGVGFQSVEILAPTEGNEIISIRAKLYDERVNSLIITVSHIGNMISFSACPKVIDERVPENANCISVTYTSATKAKLISCESARVRLTCFSKISKMSLSAISFFNQKSLSAQQKAGFFLDFFTL